MVTGMYSYETYASARSRGSSEAPSEKGSGVGYFKLVDDGDEAVVRFDYNSPNEIMMAHVHDEPVGNNKHRRVLCLRTNARDDMEKCPLCARGDRFFSKVYLKLIEYTKDENGNIAIQPKVWERPASFADQIVEYINNYGGLKDVVFKVKRIGIRGSKDTSYLLTPLPSTMYSEDKGYAKDFSGFDGFSLYPHSFLSKDKADMEEYVRTGDFPFHRRDEAVAGQSTYQPAPAPQPQPLPTGMPGTTGVHPGSVAPAVHDDCYPIPKPVDEAVPPRAMQPSGTTAPSPYTAPAPAATAPTGENNPLIDRPRRRYDYK